MTFDLHAELLKRGFSFAPLPATEARALDQRWLATFASSLAVKQRAYRWHAFSFHRNPCLNGVAALSAYRSQWSAPFYVFDETLSFCALCEAKSYPDLSALRRDIYVTHHNLKWTMAFTHEQPDLGPFYAQRPADSHGVEADD